jgi:hypothetical protein
MSSRRKIADKVGDMFADWFRKDKEAQTEAVTRLNLPANNTAQDRAKAMGYDTTAYHGTNQSFDGFDLTAGGQTNIDGNIGVFSSDSPNVASQFSHWAKARKNGGSEGAGQVYPLKIRRGNSWHVDDYDDIENLTRRHTDTPVVLDGDGRRLFSDKHTVDTDAIRKEVFNKNADSITLKNTMVDAPTDTPIDQYISLKTSDIRSPFAHFNPKMAGVGAGAVMSGNLMADELDLEYKGQEPSTWDSLMNTIGGVNQQQAQAYGDTGAGAINIATMLATDPAVAGEVISTVGLKGVGAVSPYIKGFGAGLLLDSGEASASPKYSDEDFINKLEGR